MMFLSLLLSLAALLPAAWSHTNKQVTYVCAGDYEMVGDRCYLVSQEGLTGLQSDQFCRSTGGWPAVVETQEQMDLLNNLLLDRTVYLGIDLSNRKSIVEGVLKALNHSGYMNFKIGEPNNAEGEDCVVADHTDHFRWMDVRCSNVHHVLCEASPVGIIQKVCDEESYKFDDNTCFWVSDSRYTFEQAEQVCKDRGMELASIHSVEEHIYVVDLSPMNMWIGLNDLEVEGIFKWTDNTTLNFEYWCDGEPNNESGHEDCVEFRHDDQFLDKCHGKWNDYVCDHGNAALCRGPTS